MDKPIAAISTSIGEGGIGIVRMSGEGSIDIGRSVFKPHKVEDSQRDMNRYVMYGHIMDNETIVDEVLAVFMRGPFTYTREDMVEIYTHGGIVPVRRVLELLLRKGADQAEKGEFTKRAYLNGRLDLVQAEAVMDLVSAKSDKSFDASINQLEGSLSKEIREIREEMLDMISHLEYIINFTEDGQEEPDIDPILQRGEEVIHRLIQLKDTKNRGKILREGIKTAIIGKPNVGKSSLLNALLKENRAIVTNIPGTTRDTIEEYLDLGGLTLKINDTAGIRDSSDVVESIGVQRTIELLDEADMVIAIFDLSREMDEEDQKVLELLRGRKAIVLLNKTDLESPWSEKDRSRWRDFPNVIEVSILEKKGIALLEECILNMFYNEEISSQNEVIVTNIRHSRLIEKALESMESFVSDGQNQVPIDCIEVDLRAALEMLGEITGETIEDDILDKIFREFCIGK